MRAAGLASLLWLLPAVSGAEVEVRVSGQAVAIKAKAPLSEVLAALSRQLHMQLLYDGPPPRPAVSLDISAATPAEALQSLFEGLGVNYLLTADSSGAGVGTLLVFGGGSAAPTAAPGGSSRAVDRPGPRGRLAIPALDEIPPPEESVEEPAEPPLEAGLEDPGAPPPDSFAGAVEAAIQAGAAPAPAEAKPLFPSSPFNPVPPSLAPPVGAPPPPAPNAPFQP